MQFKYGYSGPSTQGFLVFQDKNGDRTTVSIRHDIRVNPEVKKQYIGQVVVGDTTMTLFAKKKKPHSADPAGTIRMKDVVLI